MSTSLHLGEYSMSASLGAECFHHLWTYQVSYVFPSPTLVPLVQATGSTCHRSIQNSNYTCVLLGGASLVSNCSQLIGRHSWLVKHHKTSHQACFSRPCTKSSTIAALNPLVFLRNVLYRWRISSSICLEVLWTTPTYMTEVYWQCWKE